MVVPFTEVARLHARFEPPHWSDDTIVANLLLVHGLHVFDFPTWNWPSWTISTEFYTYFLFALAIGMMKDRIWRLLVPIVLLSPVALWVLAGHMDTTHDYGIIRCVFALGAISTQSSFQDFFTSSFFYLAATAAWTHAFPSQTEP